MEVGRPGLNGIAGRTPESPYYGTLSAHCFRLLGINKLGTMREVTAPLGPENLDYELDGTYSPRPLELVRATVETSSLQHPSNGPGLEKRQFRHQSLPTGASRSVPRDYLRVACIPTLRGALSAHSVSKKPPVVD